MIDRITTLMTAQTTLADINESYNRLEATQEELSTGKKINRPSDDPYGASLAVQLNSQLAGLSSYQRNIDDGTAWTQASEGALSNIANMTQRVRELVVEASNGTNSAADMRAEGAEVNQLIDAIKQEANTQYNGQYIFSGTATKTAPYLTGTAAASDPLSNNGDTYLQGAAGAGTQVYRLIGPGTQIQVNTDISSLLGNGLTDPSSAPKLLDTLRTIAADMQSGNASALGGQDLANLDTNMSTLTQMSAQAGAVVNRLQLASSRIQDLQTSQTALLSNTQDADMAQTMIDYSTQQAAYTAALKAGANIVQSSLLDFLR